MSSRNDRLMVRLKAIEVEYYYIEIKKVTVNILYFAPLQFIRQEWSIAPSIFNIKARGLAHCLL